MKTWLVPYLKKHRLGFSFAIFFSIAALICGAGLLFTSGYLISKAALRPENILMIYVPIVGVRAFGIFRAAFQYVGRLTGHDTILRVLSEMRVRLYRIVEPSALFIRSRFRSGDLLGVLSDDIEHLQDIYLRTVVPAATALVIYAVWIGIIGAFDGGFALLMALYLLLLTVIFPLLSLAAFAHFQGRLSGRRHRLYERLTDAVLGAGDWMMSGRQQSFLRRHEHEEAEVLAIERRMRQVDDWRELISQLLIGGCVLLLVYWSGGMAGAGEMDRTLIAAFVLVIFTIAESLIPVSEATERLPQYRMAFQRLEASEAASSKRSFDGSGKQQRAGSKSVRMPGGRGDESAGLAVAANKSVADIRAQHLFYKYDSENEWAIHDVSLHIGQGEKIALIGRSGAGKSTLIHLIYGALIPTRGMVTLNGAPAHTFGNEAITEMISVLNQNPHLFDTSVWNNLTIGCRADSISEEEVVHAAKQVGLDEKIRTLPQGYRTQMHEAGSIFSGGEQERLALARVLLRHTPVVILDEPTVGLDPLTEKALLQTIFRTLEDKTVIWITHHLMGAERMDQVIFLEHGHIEMQGTHECLMETNERYRRLYRLDVPDELRRAFASKMSEIHN